MAPHLDQRPLGINGTPRKHESTKQAPLFFSWFRDSRLSFINGPLGSQGTPRKHESTKAALMFFFRGFEISWPSLINGRSVSTERHENTKARNKPHCSFLVVSRFAPLLDQRRAPFNGTPRQHESTEEALMFFSWFRNSCLSLINGPLGINGTPRKHKSTKEPDVLFSWFRDFVAFLDQ